MQLSESKKLTTVLKAKIILPLMFLLAFFAGRGQAPSPPYTKPNNSYGSIYNRASFDSTLFFPTGCGIPTDTTWLFSEQNGGRAQKLRKFAIYGDSCGNKAYLWIPSLQAWQLIGKGSVDTLYSRGDSAFYTKNNTEYFAFILGTGGGTVVATNSITGNGASGTPLKFVNDAASPGNSKYYGTDGSGTKGYNTLDKTAVGLGNVDNTSDVNKPVSTAQATAIALKIANFLNVTFLGYGSHAARPTTGPGLYYDTDSSSLFFVNTGVYNNLFPVFNLFVLSQNSAYPDTGYVKAVGGNLLISPLWDSVGNCIKHSIYPDGRLVWYNSCSNVLNGGASKSISAGTLGSRPAASNCQCYYFSTTDSTWSYDNGSWIPVKGGGGGGTAAGANKQVQINNSGAFGVVPNFTADAATGLVNADSITAHKMRADSLKLNLSTAANKGFGGATKYFQGATQ
jgi:hypothetical protein